MIAEKAISILTGAVAEVEWNYPMDYAVAIDTAIQALEKQIPKKPIHKTTRFVIQGFELDDDCIYCPLCNKFIGNLSAESDFNRISTYCSDCGQALDWSDDNA